MDSLQSGVVLVSFTLFIKVAILPPRQKSVSYHLFLLACSVVIGSNCSTRKKLTTLMKIMSTTQSNVLAKCSTRYQGSTQKWLLDFRRFLFPFSNLYLRFLFRKNEKRKNFHGFRFCCRLLLQGTRCLYHRQIRDYNDDTADYWTAHYCIFVEFCPWSETKNCHLCRGRSTPFNLNFISSIK